MDREGWRKHFSETTIDKEKRARNSYDRISDAASTLFAALVVAVLALQFISPRFLPTAGWVMIVTAILGVVSFLSACFFIYWPAISLFLRRMHLGLSGSLLAILLLIMIVLLPWHGEIKAWIAAAIEPYDRAGAEWTLRNPTHPVVMVLRIFYFLVGSIYGWIILAAVAAVVYATRKPAYRRFLAFTLIWSSGIAIPMFLGLSAQGPPELHDLFVAIFTTSIFVFIISIIALNMLPSLRPSSPSRVPVRDYIQSLIDTEWSERDLKTFIIFLDMQYRCMGNRELVDERFIGFTSHDFEYLRKALSDSKIVKIKPVVVLYDYPMSDTPQQPQNETTRETLRPRYSIETARVFKDRFKSLEWTMPDARIEIARFDYEISARNTQFGGPTGVEVGAAQRSVDYQCLSLADLIELRTFLSVFLDEEARRIRKDEEDLKERIRNEQNTETRRIQKEYQERQQAEQRRKDEEKQRQKEKDMSSPPVGVKLGIYETRYLTLQDKDRTMHTYVVGSTGCGKTTLLLNMALQDIQQGKGVCIVDPNSDFASQQLLPRIPVHRLKDTVYIDPHSDPIPIAMFATKTEAEGEVLASNIIQAFTGATGEWGKRMAPLLKWIVYCLVRYPGARITDIRRVILSTDFRRRVVENLTNDPMGKARAFLLDEIDTYPNESKSAIISRLADIDTSSQIANTLDNPNAVFSIQQAVEEGKVLILNFGRCTQQAKEFIGSIVISQIYSTILRRVDIPERERIPYYLYIDEFYTYKGETLTDILIQSRKYGFALTFAHQHASQVSDIQSTCMQSGTHLLFNCEAGTAPHFKMSLGDAWQELPKLPRFTMWVKCLSGTCIKLKTLAPPEITNDMSEFIKENTRKQYYREPPKEDQQPVDGSKSGGKGGRPPRSPKVD